MTICYFGTYNPYYSRNRILLKGLRENGVDIIECRTDLSGILKYWDLIKKHWKIRKDYDVMITGFAGNNSTILVKLLTRKPVVFDAFSSSFFDSMIFDRKVNSPSSLQAKYYWLLDWLPCKLADEILLDTRVHIDYFVKTFKIKPEKFHRVWIGADDSIFYPQKQKQRIDKFLVHFHASFIPLQGAQYIIDAARILRNEDIVFQMVGSGPQYDKIKKLVLDFGLTDKVNFIGRVEIDKVPKYIARGDICLGIFGDTPKTKRVIPNKIYECIAMKKPVITADTQAIRETFQDNEQLALCKIADGKSLAKKILELKNNPELREKLAINGLNMYKNKFCPKILAKNVLNLLQGIKK